jgi:hypothetical protein
LFDLGLEGPERESGRSTTKREKLQAEGGGGGRMQLRGAMVVRVGVGREEAKDSR